MEGISSRNEVDSFNSTSNSISNSVSIQTAPSRRNLTNPDDQICSGLGQSYESPKSNRNGNGNRNLSGNLSINNIGNHSFNSNGSIKLSRNRDASGIGSGSGIGIGIRREGGFMPTPNRRSNTSTNYFQASPNKSNETIHNRNSIQENQREDQENVSFDELLASNSHSNSNQFEITLPSTSKKNSFKSNSTSPTRKTTSIEQKITNHQFRRSTRNHQPTNSTPPENLLNSIISTSPTNSPTKSQSQSQSNPNSPIKLKSKLTDGVSKPKSKVKKPPPIPNIVQSDGGSGRGLGISLGLKGAKGDHHRENHQEINRLNQDEMERELELGLEESSFVFQDGMERDGCDGLREQEQESVKVHVRLRPPKPGEKCAWIPSIQSSTLTLEPSLAQLRVQPGVGLPHKVDGILTGSDNQPVYISVARPLIRAALEGYDAVIFAYGQTASGKTYTLGSTTEEGIIQKSIKDIFRGIKQSSQSREWLLRCSYLELFNEKVLDLLEPENKPQIRDDSRKKGGGGKGIFVSPLKEEIVINEEQIKDLLNRGQLNRHVGQTDWNERSSRSHTCFKITIESWERDLNSDENDIDINFDDGERCSSPSKEPPKSRIGKKIRVSELSLIDLAGSEKYVSQGSDRRTEGSHINKSLLTLAKVIFALSERSSNNNGSSSSSNNSNHVPYRDSKLTRILQNSLSGNSKISVICTINPNPNAIDESLSTLNFAKRVKKVNLNAKKNEIEGWNDGMDGMEAKALLIRYRKEMDGLKNQVKELRRNGNNGGDSTPTNFGNGGFGIDDEKIKELKERLEIIEGLVVRGGGVEDGEESEEDDPSNSNRPTRPNSQLGTYSIINLPSHALQEKLYSANQRIQSLEKKLSGRPSLSFNSNNNENQKEKDQLKLIAKLQNQVRELEMVCEAQTLDAPPKIREDVEREWKSKVEDLEKKLLERESFLKEINQEVWKLKRTNQQLIRLAHSQTSEMVNSLNSNPNSNSTLISPNKSISSLSKPISQSAILSSQPRFKFNSRPNQNNNNNIRENRPSSVIGTSRNNLFSNNSSSGLNSPSSPKFSPRASPSNFGTPTSTTSRPSRFKPRRSFSQG